jgi:hypothetical protein
MSGMWCTDSNCPYGMKHLERSCAGVKKSSSSSSSNSNSNSSNCCNQAAYIPRNSFSMGNTVVATTPSPFYFRQPMAPAVVYQQQYHPQSLVFGIPTVIPAAVPVLHVPGTTIGIPLSNFPNHNIRICTSL